MKRASYQLFKATLCTFALLGAAPTHALDDPVTACAERAYQETGETHYEVIDKNLIFLALDDYRVELQSDTATVHCRVKSNRVRNITFTHQEHVHQEAIALR